MRCEPTCFIVKGWGSLTFSKSKRDYFMNLTLENVGLGHYRINPSNNMKNQPKFMFGVKGPMWVIFVFQTLLKKLEEKYQFNILIVVWLPGARPGVWCWKQWLIFPKRNARRWPGCVISAGCAAVTQPVRAGCARLTLTQFFFPRPRSGAPKLHQARSLRTTCSKLSQPGSVTRGGGGLKFKNGM